ncbi:hypothetical protein EDB86DRAFT_2884976 [Lactarius hatsudake]|nr:hypothetical protein EDB86DRAFT_2884976 [Lactarius hatsudake]
MSERESYVPSHPGLFQVNFKPGNYGSVLIACKDFEAAEVIAHLAGLTKAPRSYATMQCGRGPDDHVLLNSDLLYVNHSCDPNIAFDLSSPDQSKWRAYALKRIAIGEPLTFFYPSTEWLMDQPFDCTCGAPSCLRRIGGAAILSKEELLSRGAVNSWIFDAIQQRDIASS